MTRVFIEPHLRGDLEDIPCNMPLFTLVLEPLFCLPCGPISSYAAGLVMDLHSPCMLPGELCYAVWSAALYWISSEYNLVNTLFGVASYSPEHNNKSFSILWVERRGGSTSS